MMDYSLSQIGPLVYPLGALSLLGVVFIVERSIFFLRLPKIENCKRFTALLNELKTNAKQPKLLRDELLSHRLLEEKEVLEFGIRFLRMIAVISPMLGLLGTVLGMIDAFQVIASINEPVTPAMIAQGLWSAMLTTAYGLCIALPCLFAAFIFSRSAEKRVMRFQHVLNAESLRLDGVILDVNRV